MLLFSIDAYQLSVVRMTIAPAYFIFLLLSYFFARYPLIDSMGVVYWLWICTSIMNTRWIHKRTVKVGPFCTAQGVEHLPVGWLAWMWDVLRYDQAHLRCWHSGLVSSLSCSASCDGPAQCHSRLLSGFIDDKSSENLGRDGLYANLIREEPWSWYETEWWSNGRFRMIQETGWRYWERRWKDYPDCGRKRPNQNRIRRITQLVR